MDDAVIAKGPKRVGRPPKAEADRKDGNITFRTRAGLRERLAASASMSGRSMSEEVEKRLEKSYDLEDIAHFIDSSLTKSLSKNLKTLRNSMLSQCAQNCKCGNNSDHVVGKLTDVVIEAIAEAEAQHGYIGEIMNRKDIFDLNQIIIEHLKPKMPYILELYQQARGTSG
ncbi:MAG: hypothetical protein K2X71_23200 [Methylobacterium sp.]|uniref:hypothetical protein n=1 Tax=Methylobacterium sp. TaxID=409 RepID=UPI00258268F9|nr:hypothetical protein [Methylobacterium sp.]MBY0298906.1 hypothetical protein [Methylobacterium sp.]